MDQAILSVCESSFSFFLLEREWGGLAVEGDGGRLGLALDDLSTTTHPLQYWSSELDRQGPGDTECVWVLVQFLQAGLDLAIPPSILSSWLTVWQKGKGAPFERVRAPFERDRPFWKGMFNFDQWVRKGAPLLVGRAPFGRACSLLTNGWERARPFWKGALTVSHWELNLLIQHSVSRWCSSGCVHEGCGGVHHWLQTEDWCLPDFFYRQPSRQASTPCPHPHAETAELSDAISSKARKIQELK